MTRLRLRGVLALAAATGAVCSAAAAGPWRVPVAAGAGLAFALAVPGYLALSATLHGSDAAFFGAFGGGVLARLAALAGAVLAVHRAGWWPVAPFAVAAAGGLTLLSFIELIFLNRQNRLWTSSTRSNTTSSTTSTSA